MSNANAVILEGAVKNVLASATAAHGDLAVIEAAVKKEFTAAIEAIAGASNPMVGMIANLIVPNIVAGLVDGLFSMFSNLGAEIPAALSKAKTELDALTHGVL